MVTLQETAANSIMIYMSLIQVVVYSSDFGLVFL